MLLTDDTRSATFSRWCLLDGRPGPGHLRSRVKQHKDIQSLTGAAAWFEAASVLFADYVRARILDVYTSQVFREGRLRPLFACSSSRHYV